MLSSKKVIIAHGVQQRQDTVFLAYKTEFDQLSESDFVDFWCVYIASLACEQFVRNDHYKVILNNCAKEIASFRAAYNQAGIPDFDRRLMMHEILA